MKATLRAITSTLTSLTAVTSLTALTALTALTISAGLAWGRQPVVAAAASERAAASSRLPWKEAGLTERQAAAHLLNRFAFGARQGEIDSIISGGAGGAGGLDRWFESQLAANLPDPNLDARLRDLPALAMAEPDIARIYRGPGQILNEAQKDGVITKDELAAAKTAKTVEGLYRKGADLAAPPGIGAPPDEAPPETPAVTAVAVAAGVGAGGGPLADLPALRVKLLRFARERGYRPLRELQQQLLAQKLLRAVESNNQLREVMTDFWFNHFNVSLTNNRAQPYILPYERDAIRPHALGTVRALLEATARHPAMLYYLDNAESTAAPDAPTLMGDEMQSVRGARRGPFGYGPPPMAAKGPKGKGLNENYARELMELHTLGVDGGYSQQDVVEVARAFTGWTVLPAGPAREAAEKRLAKVGRFGGLGFQSDGDFLFRADMHDDGQKAVLGRRLPPGRGMQDGEDVLDLLANHPSTARHLATQLAVRFVSDRPPRTLIDRLVATYDRTGGDVREMLRTLAHSPEFWSHDSVGAKVKSPFELAVSAVRAAGAHVEQPRALLGWIARMGQPLYAYQAPTGYPDRADAWVNTGSLLNRMNFGLQFAAQRVAGVDMDLPSLHDGREPESREEALGVYAALVLPGRDLASTIRLLTPMLSDPGLAHAIDSTAPAAAAAPPPPPHTPPVRAAGAEARGDDDTTMAGDLMAGDESGAGGAAGAGAVGRGGAGGGGGGGARRRQPEVVRAVHAQHTPTAIEQVVGLILGSPEFQRR
jgi:uncharacterized protein (DUF1800 family)